MKALILMAGHGQRFKDRGYTFPKPLLDIAGKLTIQWVIESLPECEKYIFVAQREHETKYNLTKILQMLTDNRAEVVLLDGVTEGAAVSALTAETHINNEEELIIANSDQYVTYNRNNFDLLRQWSIADGIIFVFNSFHPKWSYCKLNEVNQSVSIAEVVEKIPVSDTATCGLYYFNRGSVFVACAKKMIEKNIRTNGEFYLAPVYNELINNNHSLVLPFWVDKMAGLGTPEDAEYFIRNH